MILFLLPGFLDITLQIFNIAIRFDGGAHSSDG
jgi:hypothetical protein